MARFFFTRKQDENFDIDTIKPYGRDVRRMTTFPANDAHAVWTEDVEYIMWNSGEYGFKDCGRALRQLVSTLWIDLDHESKRHGKAADHR